MFHELWVMLHLAYDFLLQAVDLVVDGLCGRAVCQLCWGR